MTIQTCWLYLSICCAAMLALVGRATANDQNPYEMVLKQSAKIHAQFEGHSIEIEATSELERRIYIDGCIHNVVLRPRSERWYGSKGGYNPGLTKNSSQECNNITRVVITEGQIHFNDEKFALEWLSRRPKSYFTVHSRDGFVVFWSKHLPRSQINVDIRLMCLNAKAFDIDRENRKIILARNSSKNYYKCASNVYFPEIDRAKDELLQFWRQADSARINHN